VRSVVACLRPDNPAACPFAADSSEPDRPQAVKAGAVAPSLRGFGLDGLTPPRFGRSKQTKADWGRTALPIRTAIPTPTMCLATAATTPAPQGSGKPRAYRAARAHDDAGDRRRGYAHLYAGNQSAQPPAPKLIGIHPPRACRSRESPSRRSCSSSSNAVGTAPCPTG
jgi:hypothetical protein